MFLYCSTGCIGIVLVALLSGRGGVLAAGDIRGSACRAPPCQKDAGAPPILSVGPPAKHASLQVEESLALRPGAWKKSSAMSPVRPELPGRWGEPAGANSPSCQTGAPALGGSSLAFGLAALPTALAGASGASPLAGSALPLSEGIGQGDGEVGKNGLNHRK